jgi:amino acid permease
MASEKVLPSAHGDEKNSAVPYDETVGVVEARGNTDALQRHLGNRQIQMIAIGGSIGTALFVSIGNGLMDGGPGSLFIAFALYSALLGLVNNCMAEMAVYMPVSGMQHHLHVLPDARCQISQPAAKLLTAMSRFFYSLCWKVG